MFSYVLVPLLMVWQLCNFTWKAGSSSTSLSTSSHSLTFCEIEEGMRKVNCESRALFSSCLPEEWTSKFTNPSEEFRTFHPNVTSPTTTAPAAVTRHTTIHDFLYLSFLSRQQVDTTAAHLRPRIAGGGWMGESCSSKKYERRIREMWDGWWWGRSATHSPQLTPLAHSQPWKYVHQTRRRWSLARENISASIAFSWLFLPFTPTNLYFATGPERWANCWITNLVFEKTRNIEREMS